MKIYTKTHKIIEMAAWLMIVASYAVAIYGIHTLPSKIAIHFNAAGEADGYGTPTTLLLMPVIMTFCLGIISLVAHRCPEESFNVPFKVNEKNSDKVYTTIFTMIYLVELEIALFALYIAITSYFQTVKGIWIALVIFIAALTATIIWSTVKASKQNKED